MLLACIKSIMVPPKNEVSVKIDCAAIQAFKYPSVTASTVDVSLMTPLEGDCLLNSAIIPVDSCSMSALRKERGVLLNRGRSAYFRI